MCHRPKGCTLASGNAARVSIGDGNYLPGRITGAGLKTAKVIGNGENRMMEPEDEPLKGIEYFRNNSPWRTKPKQDATIVIKGREKKPARPKGDKNFGERSARPVRCRETGKIYASGVEASRAIGKADNCVCNAINKFFNPKSNKKRPTAGGYTWEYYTGPMPEKGKKK